MYICNVATTSTDRDSITYTERVESMYFAKVHSPLGSKSPSYRKRVDESKGQVINNQEERKNCVEKPKAVLSYLNKGKSSVCHCGEGSKKVGWNFKGLLYFVST